MSFKQQLQIWIQQIRGPFLSLSVVLVLIGTAMAHHYGVTDWRKFALLTVGVILAHISVNLFNELSDFHTEIDNETRRTPFSGGSGMMQAGFTTPSQVRAAAYGTLIIAGLIGLYFTITVGWKLLVILLIGGLAIRFYTNFFANWALGEALAGLTLGYFVVLGSVMCYRIPLNPALFFIAIPSGLLTSQLLFLNEFPDVDADRTGGRRHLVILLGPKNAAILGAAIYGLVYLVIILAPIIYSIPKLVWLGLLTLPMAVQSIGLIMHSRDKFDQLVRALGLNIGVVMLTNLLIAAGYFIA